MFNTAVTVPGKAGFYHNTGLAGTPSQLSNSRFDNDSLTVWQEGQPSPARLFP